MGATYIKTKHGEFLTSHVLTFKDSEAFVKAYSKRVLQHLKEEQRQEILTGVYNEATETGEKKKPRGRKSNVAFQDDMEKKAE